LTTLAIPSLIYFQNPLSRIDPPHPDPLLHKGVEEREKKRGRLL
jgi:hypothetical protein